MAKIRPKPVDMELLEGGGAGGMGGGGGKGSLGPWPKDIRLTPAESRAREEAVSAISRSKTPPKEVLAAEDAAKAALEKASGKLKSSVDWKRGGKDAEKNVEKGMKKGGKVSSASKRADGIAQRGKTRA